MPFGSQSQAADVQPGAGIQIFTSPPESDLNVNGRTDLEEAARTLRSPQIQLFTPQVYGTGNTHYDHALEAMNQAFAAEPAGEQNIAFFFSDGVPNCSTSDSTCGSSPYTGMSGPLAEAVAQGTVANTFAVGAAAGGCGAGQPLAEIAARTNGTCTQVSDPSELSTSIARLVPSGLNRVELNGSPVTVDSVGNFSGEVTCTSGAQIVVQAVGFANDAGGTGVSADVTIQCCTDSDGDGSCDADDACPYDPENDADGDGICGDVDNCRVNANADQADADGDGAGDVCDACPNDAENDADGDGVCGDVDNCRVNANADQADADGDGAGDVCDACPNDADNDIDHDAICGDVDNCRVNANADQADRDADGLGDVCDACPNDGGNDADGDGVCADVDRCPGTQIPEAGVTLQTNRFALMDADGVFDTVLPEGQGPGRSYTTKDTGGCSCTQIVSALHLGVGQSKFGCSVGVMDNWARANGGS